MPSAVLFPFDWSSVDHVVLDFGGVLYGIDHSRTADAFAELGFPHLITEFRHGSQSPLFDRLERGETTADEFLLTLQNRCATGTRLEQVQAAWNTMLLGLHTDALPWVQSLARRFDLILLSNTNPIHAAHFEKEILKTKGRAFSDAFRHIIYSHRLGQRKPDVHTFEWVARDLNLVPERTVLIDDTKENVAGAIAAGWHGIHFDMESFSFAQFVRGIGYEDFVNR